MIVRHMPGGRAYVDREALIVETGLSEVTIRSRLRPVGYDKLTGRALYDYDKAKLVLDGVKPLPQMQGKRRAA